jgi:hypothetical protein
MASRPTCRPRAAAVRPLQGRESNATLSWALPRLLTCALPGGANPTGISAPCKALPFREPSIISIINALRDDAGGLSRPPTGAGVRDQDTYNPSHYYVNSQSYTINPKLQDTIPEPELQTNSRDIFTGQIRKTYNLDLSAESGQHRPAERPPAVTGGP